MPLNLRPRTAVVGGFYCGCDEFHACYALFHAWVRKGRGHILLATARADVPLDGGVEVGEGWKEVFVMPRGHPQVRGDRRGQVEFSASPVGNVAAIAVAH